MATRKSSSSDTDPSNPVQQFQDAVSQAMQGATEQLQSLNLTGAGATLLENGRKDIEALVAANKRSYDSLQAVVQRQSEGLRQSITAWQSAFSNPSGQDLSAQMSQLDQMGRAAFQQALNDMRELAEAAASSQKESFEIVRQRIQDNVDQVQQLLQSGLTSKKK